MTPVRAVRGDGIAPSLEELIALRRIANHSGGARRGSLGNTGTAPAAIRGRGMEYAESREYVAGDDTRHIDWKLSARTGRTQTKLFQAERERLTLLVADTAPALYFGTRVRFKSVQAARAGAVATWWAQRQGDRVSVLRGSTSEHPLTPAGGVRGVLPVLDALKRWYQAVPPDDAGLTFALERASRLIRPGSRIIVLADPASAAAVPTMRWATLAAHSELQVVLLVDALELEPPAGVLPFMTSAGRIELDMDASGMRRRWQEGFQAPVTSVMNQLKSQRAQVHLLRADADSDAWLAQAAARGRH